MFDPLLAVLNVAALFGTAGGGIEANHGPARCEYFFEARTSYSGDSYGSWNVVDGSAVFDSGSPGLAHNQLQSFFDGRLATTANYCDAPAVVTHAAYSWNVTLIGSTYATPAGSVGGGTGVYSVVDGIFVGLMAVFLIYLLFFAIYWVLQVLRKVDNDSDDDAIDYYTDHHGNERWRLKARFRSR